MNYFKWFLVLTCALVVSALVVHEARSQASSGGGSAVNVSGPYPARGTVIGNGTVTRIGPRYAAAYTISLYRIPPGAVRGRFVTSSGAQVPRDGQQVNVTTRAFCRAERRPSGWFTILRVNSIPRRGAKPVLIRSQSRTVMLRCGA